MVVTDCGVRAREGIAVAGFSSTEQTGSPSSPTVTIRSILPSLPPAERRVAERVLTHPGEVLFLSIGAIAQEAATSEATVVRFCKKAGFDGYPGLRLALASEVGRSTAENRSGSVVGIEIGPDDSLGEVVVKVGALDAQAIADTVEHLNIEVLASVVELVTGARRIELYGIGASGLVAIDLEQKLRRIGLPSAASIDGHAALTSAAVSSADDVVLAISHSGQTLDVIEPVEQARSQGATTVAITNYLHSPLAEAADLVLTTAARESALRSGAMASRAAQLTVVDCVFIGVAQRNYEDTLVALDRTYAAVRGRRRTNARPR
jgi:DNA-binding MurR/RpiR family transcriptional regulator